MDVSGQLTGFELEDLMTWTVSNLQRPFRDDFSLQKSGALFQFLKGRWLQRLKRQAGEDLSDLIFLQQENRSHGHPKHKSSVPLP